MEKKTTDELFVTKSATVNRNVHDAFHSWTEQINEWWPKSHSVSRDPQTRVFIEGKAEGRFFERTSQGVEHDWGCVLIWNPPTHLAYLWYLGSSQQLPTRVDVNFVELSKDRTRIDVIHRGPELIGELWGINQRRYIAAWDTVLPEFAAFCQTES